MNKDDGAWVVVEFDRGSRSEPPEERYAAPVRLDGDDVQRSLVLDLREALDADGWKFFAVARFLVEDAPHQRLAAPTTFELFEGPHVVATGRVLTAAGGIDACRERDTALNQPKPRQYEAAS